MAALLLLHSPSATNVQFGGMGNLKGRNHHSILSSKKPMRGNYLRLCGNNSSNGISAFFNPVEDPVIKEALKEPVAFAGGLFAGLLRLDLNEDPLREWVKKTVESVGLTEEVESEGSVQEDGPMEIEIE